MTSIRRSLGMTLQIGFRGTESTPLSTSTSEIRHHQRNHMSVIATLIVSGRPYRGENLEAPLQVPLSMESPTALAYTESRAGNRSKAFLIKVEFSLVGERTGGQMD